MNKKITIETPIAKEDCGCLVLAIAKRGKHNKTNLSAFKIKHCPKHTAAPDLYKACKDLIEQFIKYTTLDHEKCWEIIKARQVLAKYEGK